MGRRVTDEQGYDMIFFGLVLILGGTAVLIVMCRAYGVHGLFQVRAPGSPTRGRAGRSGADRRTGRQAQARRAKRPAPVRRTDASPVPVRKGGRPVSARNGGRAAQGRPEGYRSGRPEAPPQRDDAPDATYHPPARPGAVYRSSRPDGSPPPDGRHGSNDRHSRGAPHQIPNSVPPRRRSAPAQQPPPEP